MSYETEQIPSGDVDPYPKLNANDQSYGQARTFAHIPGASSGLVLRIGGGDYGGAVVDGEDLTATDDATNYVVALKSTGALSISTATTNWNDTDYGRVCIATYASGALVDDKVVDVRFEPLGIFGSQQATPAGSNTVTAVTSTSGVVDIDCSLGDYFTLALSENVTSITFSNLPGSGVGASKMLRITQDSTPRTVAWPASFKWEGGVAGVVSTGSGDVDVLAITSFDNGTAWMATLAKDFA
jgi:hypothetical protein